jgi:hypothetical protein
MELNLARKVDEVPEPTDCDSYNQSFTSRCEGDIIERQHYVSPLIFSDVRWLVRHDPMENFGEEGQRIEMISFWKDFNG